MTQQHDEDSLENLDEIEDIDFCLEDDTDDTDYSGLILEDDNYRNTSQESLNLDLLSQEDSDSSCTVERILCVKFTYHQNKKFNSKKNKNITFGFNLDENVECFISENICQNNKFMSILKAVDHTIDILCKVKFEVEGKFEDDILKVFGFICREGFYINDEGRERHFKFIGSSRSGQDAQSCYFIDIHQMQIQEALTLIGQFPTNIAPEKLASLIGLNFSKAKAGIEIKNDEYIVIEDETEATDGAGVITFSKIRSLLPCVGVFSNSVMAIQIRFKGFKGMLVAIDDEIIHTTYGEKINIVFRKTMKKYEASDHDTILHVLNVNNSSSGASINGKQMFILTELAKKKSEQSQQAVQEYFKTLAQHELDNLRLLQNNPGEYFNSIQKHKDPKYAILVKMFLVGSYNIPPYIHNQHMYVKGGYCRMLNEGKLKLHLPNSARLYGVPDPLDDLEYNEIYMRCDVLPSFTGPCIVSRDPLLYAGSFRPMVVKPIPEKLNYLNNIIIFSKKINPATNRSILLDMQGDLDGDWYFVICEEVIVQNIQTIDPLDYKKEKNLTISYNKSLIDLHAETINIFLRHKKDNIISMADSRNNQSMEHYGIDARETIIFAKEHAQAIDSVKHSSTESTDDTLRKYALNPLKNNNTIYWCNLKFNPEKHELTHHSNPISLEDLKEKCKNGTDVRKDIFLQIFDQHQNFLPKADISNVKEYVNCFENKSRYDLEKKRCDQLIESFSRKIHSLVNLFDIDSIPIKNKHMYLNEEVINIKKEKIQSLCKEYKELYEKGFSNKKEASESASAFVDALCDCFERSYLYIIDAYYWEIFWDSFLELRKKLYGSSEYVLLSKTILPQLKFKVAKFSKNQKCDYNFSLTSDLEMENQALKRTIQELKQRICNLDSPKKKIKHNDTPIKEKSEPMTETTTITNNPTTISITPNISISNPYNLPTIINLTQITIQSSQDIPVSTLSQNISSSQSLGTNTFKAPPRPESPVNTDEWTQEECTALIEGVNCHGTDFNTILEVNKNVFHNTRTVESMHNFYNSVILSQCDDQPNKSQDSNVKNEPVRTKPRR